MVVRIYRATPKPEKLKDYEKLLIEEVVPYVQQANGCIQARVLKSLGVVREILFISVWDNLESVKAFCGPGWASGILVGTETEMLEGPPEVKHYHQITSF